VRERLLAAGLSGATPAAIVENGSRPEQRISVGTVGGLVELARGHRGGEAALLIVGAVAAFAGSALPSRLQEAS
jgi:uroporphyrin-III C-methyltransferase/precorrin-2 dehydrogenase/sirohydrochlorin ferrochelatase